MILYDICIFGAGPSGSAIGRRLAQLGYAVIIIEKETFPRKNVGISISPGVLHWLDVLDLRNKIEQANCINYCDSYLLWDSDVPVKRDSKSNFQTDRKIFDKILLDGARIAGAHFIRSCDQVFYNETEDRKWLIKSSSFTFSAKFIIDACGRRSILKGLKSAYLPKTLALYAYWGARLNASFVEAGQNHWYWAAPTSNQEFVACIFADPKDVKVSKNKRDFYMEKMQEFTLLKHINVDKNDFGELSICSATAYIDNRPIGPNYIKVGDAAFSTDPLSAQGVQKALKMAIQGATIVNTILSGNNQIALNFYRERIQQEVDKNKKWTLEHFNNQVRYVDGEFWQSRKFVLPKSPPEKLIQIKLHDILIVNPQITYITTSVIIGDLIEERQGVKIDNNSDVVVYIQDTPIVKLLHALHGHELKSCLGIIKIFISKSKPMEIIKYLIFHNLIITTN